MLKKELRREGIRKRIRKTISGTAERPRLSVFRSNKQIYAQLIDDLKGNTMIAVSSTEADFKDIKSAKVDLAKAVGKTLAEKAQQAAAN